MLRTSTFLFSPLHQEFWQYLKDEEVFAQNWIHKMGVGFKKPSMPSIWMSYMKLSSLKSLVIAGNNWEHGENTLEYHPSLRELYLPKNNITSLPPDMLRNTPLVDDVILIMNKLESLPVGLSQLRMLDVSNQSSVLVLSDEVISSLVNIEILTINTRIKANFTQVFKLPLLNTLYCRGCWLDKIENYTTHFRENDELYSLDLGMNNLTSLPEMVFASLKNLSILLMDNNLFEDCPCGALNSTTQLQVLNLSKNHISDIQPLCFSGLEKLFFLDMSWNNLTEIENSTFENAFNLRFLNLSYNNLFSVREAAFSNLMQLSSLNLSHNNLEEAPYLKINKLDELDLSYNTLKTVTKIASVKTISYLNLCRNNITELKLGRVSILNLSYNALEYISDDMWQYLENTSLLDLGKNHFLCCHKNFTILQGRLNASHDIVCNLNTSDPLACFPDTQEANVLLSTFKDQDLLCFIEIINITLFLAAPLAALSIAMVFFTALLYYYRFEFSYIRNILKKKKSGQKKDDQESKDCFYDAFVCYSWKNESWVAGQLVPNLEKEPYKYRLCLHTRDFTIGAAIDKNVTEALKKSRKVICILTDDFRKSKWCQWELGMAAHKMFREERDYIILIELERFQRTNLPTDLEYLMDSRTYLEWPNDSDDQQGTERCWKRLRQALGESLVKRMGQEGPKGSVMDL